MLSMLLGAVIVGIILLSAYIIRGLLTKVKKYKSMSEKYTPLADIDSEIQQRKVQLDNLNESIKSSTSEKELAEKQLKATIEYARNESEKIQREISLLSDELDLTSSGFYKNKYNFDSSEKYEIKMEEIRAKQKSFIQSKSAITCSTEWTIDGSKAQGKKMIDRVIKLGLSAFNVQCDNEIIKVKFGNIGKATEKIEKIRENIDKLLEPNLCKINYLFYELKIQELQLAYEYQEKLFKEKEEQKAIREQMREEEKARKEIERMQAEAEREEKRYSDALEKAKLELSKKSESEQEKLNLKIADLEAKLKEAQENKERAKAQAEMTRRGHVYIISNVGSFGEDVYKIGMTRRLDPMERVYELGDASVPFEFDVHAIIQSEDAPSLEKKLHESFTQKRLNRMNERKEFFKVNLQEIANEVKRHHDSEFRLTLIAEAKEWRQSIALVENSVKKSAA